MSYDGCFTGSLANNATINSGTSGVPILTGTNPYTIRSLIAGSGIMLTSDATSITISRTGGSGSGGDLQDAYDQGNTIALTDPLIIQSIPNSLGVVQDKKYIYPPRTYFDGDLILAFDAPERISYIKVVFLGYSGTIDVMVRFGIKFSLLGFFVHTHNASDQVPLSPIIVNMVGSVLNFNLSTNDALEYTIGTTVTQISLT